MTSAPPRASLLDLYDADAANKLEDLEASLSSVNLTAEQRRLLEAFDATFEGEQGTRHSPRTSTFLDGVKAFWNRVTS